MGVVAILGLAVTAASAVVQYSSGKKAAKAREEQSAINTANEKNKDAIARRRQARADRIKRASIENTAENRGASGSSGEAGALSGLAANGASAVAFQTGQQNTASGLSAQERVISQAQQTANNAKLFGSIVNTGLSLYDEYKEDK